MSNIRGSRTHKRDERKHGQPGKTGHWREGRPHTAFSPFKIEKAAYLLQGKGGNVPACLSKTEV